MQFSTTRLKNITKKLKYYLDKPILTNNIFLLF